MFPGYFKHSFWKPGFGCQVPDSAKNQVDFIQKKLQEADREKRIFLYVNIDAIHYPNWFYLGENAPRHDTIESHKAALRCADTQLGRLFDWWRETRGDAFVICCSDHGTCYGEDGCQFHGISHPAVEAVPYKHFFPFAEGGGKQRREVMRRYVQYMYSYPHKTAYRPLEGVSLEDRAGLLAERENEWYIHLPFCESKCGYCNLFSVAGADPALIEAYLDRVEIQASQYREMFERQEKMPVFFQSDCGRRNAPSPFSGPAAADVFHCEKDGAHDREAGNHCGDSA